MKNLKILLCALIAPICFAIPFFLGGSNQVLAQENEKQYSYVVSTANQGLNVVGKYADNTTYFVAQGISLESVGNMIDADRFSGSGFENAEVYFQNVTVADNYLHLSNGEITLSGSLSSTGYSTYGLVYVDGATVRFEDCNFSNNGLSYLVKNVGAGGLQFANGTFMANSTVIASRGAGSVEILGGTFTSSNASVIEFAPSTPSRLSINQAQNFVTKLVAKGTKPAIVAKNSEVLVLGGRIESAGQTVFLLENAPLVLANAPTLTTTAAHIKTNSQIFASYFSCSYTGAKLLVEFTGEISSGETVVIKNGQAELFELANDGYLLKQVGEDCVIAKFSVLEYQDPRGFIKNMPVDQRKYLLGETATLASITHADVVAYTMDKYRFMGWSVNPNATSAEYPESSALEFAEEDITLYAVWQAFEFIITYENLQGAQNNNPSTYTTEDTITLNAPVRDLYVFKGWKVNGESFVQETYTIRAGSFGALTLEAVWDYQKFEIAYHGISAEDVQNLNLATTYTIISSPLEITLEDVLCKGFAFFGLYLNEELTDEFPETIFFDDWDRNSSEFLKYNAVGQTINIYVDTRPYSNGTGAGTQENPYVLDDKNQFLALFMGEKVVTEQPIYITLAQNLAIDQSLQGGFTGFKNFVIDGQGRTIAFTQSAFGNFDGQTTFLPEITNCTLKNANIDIGTQSLNKSQSLQFAFAGNIENSNFENITIVGQVNLLLDDLQSASTLKFGALAITAVNSEFINFNNQTSFNIACTAQNADINIYGAGIIGFSSDNCKFVNCQSAGDIAIDVDNQREAFIYISAFANLGAGCKIWNCFSTGDIIANAENSSGILCGAMAFGGGNALYNVVNLGTISKGDAMRVFATPNAFAGAGVVEQKNVFSSVDFVSNAQAATLQKLAGGVAALSSQTSAPLNVWFVQNDCVKFAPGIVVNFVGKGLMPNQTLHFANPADAGKKFIAFNTQKYLFQGWHFADDTPVDWENITSQQITVYAKYIAFDDVVKQEQTIAVGIAIGVFLIFLFILYLFDKKKPVRYYFKDEWIDTRRFGRTKIVTLPPEFEGRICFLDKAGEKPFLKKKMPCHKISLFVFEDEKQNRLEEFWNQFFELKKNKKEEKKLKKIKNKEEKIKKQQEIEKQKEKQKKKQKAKSNKKSTNIAKKSSKKRVIKNSKDAKITIIKQEIKMKKK